uniref:Uncharacterized protein n=1 Tax=Myotis myotis TaxID=51298 RepID=A0A7J7R745_MYOMY|nr:hypothetical protein mMyoMyo1_010891 [Myotis myotis]
MPRALAPASACREWSPPPSPPPAPERRGLQATHCSQPPPRTGRVPQLSSASKSNRRSTHCLLHEQPPCPPLAPGGHPPHRPRPDAHLERDITNIRRRFQRRVPALTLRNRAMTCNDRHPSVSQGSPTRVKAAPVEPEPIGWV